MEKKRFNHFDGEVVGKQLNGNGKQRTQTKVNGSLILNNKDLQLLI